MSKEKKTAEFAPSRSEKKSFGQYILGLILLLYTIVCAMPILLVFIAAFTDDTWIAENGFSFFPGKLSMAGFNSVLRYGDSLVTSYGVTIFVTLVGTTFGLLVMSMFAYSISRKGFRLARFLSIYLLIPMLFNGGQLSGYIVFTNWYHLKDSLLLLILPLSVTTMNVIILRTYIANSIPDELMEAAKIDGAGRTSSSSASVSVGKRLMATTQGRPKVVVMLDTWRSRLGRPFSSASRFSVFRSALATPP